LPCATPDFPQAIVRVAAAIHRCCGGSSPAFESRSWCRSHRRNSTALVRMENSSSDPLCSAKLYCEKLRQCGDDAVHSTFIRSIQTIRRATPMRRIVKHWNRPNSTQMIPLKVGTSHSEGRSARLPPAKRSGRYKVPSVVARIHFERRLMR
jgi:hypothetical protein